MLDMFASEEEFEKQLEKEKKKEELNVQKKNDIVENAETVENQALKDNWDDKEGYYKPYVGEVFAYKYKVVEETGKGVFSTVIRCIDMASNETVAIKVLRSNEKMTSDAKNELSLLEVIKSKDPQNQKHCIPVHNSFMYRNHLCIVFPYMAFNLRDTLRKYGAGVGLSLIAIQSFARQLFLALLHIKKLGIVHADIKPDNILLKDEKSSWIELTDFGNSFYANDSNNLPTPYLASRFYRAPEIILGLKYGGLESLDVIDRLSDRRLVGWMHALRAFHGKSHVSGHNKQWYASIDSGYEGTCAASDGEKPHYVVRCDEPRGHVYRGFQVHIPDDCAGFGGCET